MRKCGLVLILATVAAVTGARESVAAPITWTFTGVLQVVSGGAVPSSLQALGVQVGAPVHGSLSFESSTPDTRPGDATSGAYIGAVLDAQVSIAGWTLPKGVYAPDPSQTVSDLYTVYMPTVKGEFSEIDMLDPTGTFISSLLQLDLESNQPGVFSSDALPSSPPSLASLTPFGADPNTIAGFGSGVFFYESGATFLSSLSSLQRVPEPSLPAVVALGQLALLLRRRSSGVPSS